MVLVLGTGRACPFLSQFPCMWHWERDTKVGGLPDAASWVLGCKFPPAAPFTVYISKGNKGTSFQASQMRKEDYD